MKSYNFPYYYSFKKHHKALQYFMMRKFNQFDPLGNYMIFSDPRGGSTWLSEMLSEMIGKPVLWEPLHLKKVDTFSKLGFGWRQYIPEDGNWTEAKNAFDKLLKGKIINDWTLSRSSIKEFRNADRLIIKFCRANALLPYLTNQYKFTSKPIYLIRHPFSVVASQLKHGDWVNTPTEYVIPNTKFNSHYIEHSDFLKTLKSKEEILTANWCLSNQFPMNNKRNNVDWITVNYETLLIHPEETLKRIFRIWKIDCDLTKIDFKKRSSTTLDGSEVEVDKRLSAWKQQFNSTQILNMLSVLNYFNIQHYDENIEPIIKYS